VEDGTEGPGRFDELDKLVVASLLQTLQTEWTSRSRAEGGGRARGSRLRTRAADEETDVAGRGEKVCGGGGDQRR
jgi:hypothetical protein